MREEVTLLEVLGQVIVHNKGPFDDAMGSRVSSTKAVTVLVPLCFLDAVDLFGNRLNVLGFAIRDVLYTIRIPTNVISLGHVIEGSPVGTIGLGARCGMNRKSSSSVCHGRRHGMRMCVKCLKRGRNNSKKHTCLPTGAYGLDGCLYG